jgi:phosphoribosyl-AMP cyclohydrolase
MSPAPETPAETLLSVVKLDAQGLVPVIAQEIETGMVRMFAWANREALELTASTGFAHFWSRSRGALWKKGETSGHTLAVRRPVSIVRPAACVLPPRAPTRPS